MNTYAHNVGRVAATAVTRICSLFSNFRAAIREARELEVKLSRDRHPFIDV
jgi:hypothetical protein